MTKLEAVNALLSRVGLPPVAALDTGNASLQANAERKIDQCEDDVQRQGWHWNLFEDVELTIPDVKITLSGAGTGTFVYGETVTESTSGATGTFAWRDGNTAIYLRGVSGTFTGGETLTGSTSAATAPGNVYSAQTTGKLPVPDDVYHIDTYGDSAGTDVVQRNGFLYDRDDNTLTFTGSLKVEYTQRLDWLEIPPAFQAWIVAEAAILFVRDYANSINRADRRELLGELDYDRRRDRMTALQEEADASDRNILNTSEMLRVKGNRRQFYRYNTL